MISKLLAAILFSICFLVTPYAMAKKKTSKKTAESARKIIGTVEIPKLFGSSGFTISPDLKVDTSPLKIYRSPNTKRGVFKEIKSKDEVVSREHDFDEHSALVFSKGGEGWYLIRLKSGSYGWVDPKETGKFRSFYDLVRKKPSYVTDDWPGIIYKKAGSKKRVAIKSLNPRIVGFVQTKGLSRYDNSRQKGRPDKEIIVRKTPKEDGFKIGKMIYSDQLPPEIKTFVGLDANAPLSCTEPNTCRELTEKESRIPVLEEKDGWLKLRFNEWSHLHSKFGWIKAEGDFANFKAYDNWRQKRAAYQAFYGPEEVKFLEILGRTEVDKQLWFEVRLMSGSCGNPEAKVMAEGWIPAHTQEGKETLWFKASGC